MEGLICSICPGRNMNKDIAIAILITIIVVMGFGISCMSMVIDEQNATIEKWKKRWKEWKDQLNC